VTATVSHEPAPRLGPHERLERLCDPGTLQVIRTEVTSARMGSKARPGDGVVGAAGRVGGRPGRRPRGSVAVSPLFSLPKRNIYDI